MITGKKPKKSRTKYKPFIIVGLLFVFLILSYRYVEKELMPTVITIAEMKIRTISANIINTAVQEVLKENSIQTESLVTYYYDEKSKVVSIGVNSVAINSISTEVLTKITNKIDDYKSEDLFIPIGRLLGNSVFSNFGPKIKISILPYGTVTINYDSSFTATGINQINHRIWLNVEMNMQVVIPVNTTQIKTNHELTIMDRVINGDVPNQYIVLPSK